MEEVMMIDINKLVITSQPIMEATDVEKNNLRENIEDVGLLYPLLVRVYGEDGDQYEILDGRTRYEVLNRLGYKTVKCIIRAGDEVENETVPYDSEVNRRHLSKQKVGHFRKVRNEKRVEAEESYVKTMLERLPKECREEVEEHLSTLPSDESRRRNIDLFVTWSPAELRDYLNTLDYRKHCDRLEEEVAEIKEEKEELVSKLADFEMNKEDEIKKRLEKFSKTVEEEVKKLKESGTVIPEDEEEKARFLKKIEEQVAEQFRKRIEESEKNVEKMQKRYLTLEATLEEKKEEVTKLKRSKKDSDAALAKADDRLHYFADVLDQKTDASKVVKRFNGITDDLACLNNLLIERQYTVEEIGKENRKALLSSLTGIQKVLGETESVLKDIA